MWEISKLGQARFLINLYVTAVIMLYCVWTIVAVVIFYSVWIYVFLILTNCCTIAVVKKHFITEKSVTIRLHNRPSLISYGQVNTSLNDS